MKFFCGSTGFILFGTICALCTRTRFLLHVLVVFIRNLNIYIFTLSSSALSGTPIMQILACSVYQMSLNLFSFFLLLLFYLLWCSYFGLKIYFMTVMKPSNLFFYQKLRGYNEYIERGYNEHSERFLVLVNLHKLTK